MSTRRRSSPREDERRELKKRWQENCKRRKAGWPPTSAELELFGTDLREIDHFNFYSTSTFDGQGEPVTIKLRGEEARKASRAMDERLAKMRDSVENWNKKVDGGKRVKEISGKDVMEVLEIASMLTDNPAFEAARRAMRLYQLDSGGLRRGFLALRDRHIAPPEVACVLSVEPEPDNVTWYIEEYGYTKLRAIEHVVANQGIPGASFERVVERVGRNYNKRKQLKDKRQQYRAAQRREPA